MEYVLLRYKDRPDHLAAVASTLDAGEAVTLLRRWCREDPELGVIVAVDGHAFVHCTPRR